MIITVTNDCFGKNLIYFREKNALSQLAMARLLNTAEVIIACWEEGKVYPSFSKECLERICMIFQTNTEEILHTDMTAGG